MDERNLLQKPLAVQEAGILEFLLRYAYRIIRIPPTACWLVTDQVLISFKCACTARFYAVLEAGCNLLN